MMASGWIVHADAALLVVDKPAGLLSVPGRGSDKADCAWSRAQREFADALVVHRLDMATSGLLLFARGIEMQRALSHAFAARRVEKRYLAWVESPPGRPAGPREDEGVIDLPLAADWPARPRQKVDPAHGKPALTRFRVCRREGRRALVELVPVTGRTHQLRVHAAAVGWPIVGDVLYGGVPAERLLLHASRLGFTHPSSGATIELSTQARWDLRLAR